MGEDSVSTPKHHIHKSRILLTLFFVLPFLLPSLDSLTHRVFKLFPPRPVQLVTQLPEIVHLTPAIPSPLATRHIDHEVSVTFGVMDSLVHPVLAAGAHREAVYLPLGDKCRMRAYPRLIDVEVFEGVLLFVLPLHMFLFVTNRVPPDI